MFPRSNRKFYQFRKTGRYSPRYFGGWMDKYKQLNTYLILITNNNTNEKKWTRELQKNVPQFIIFNIYLFMKYKNNIICIEHLKE